MKESGGTKSFIEAGKQMLDEENGELGPTIIDPIMGIPLPNPSYRYHGAPIES